MGDSVELINTRQFPRKNCEVGQAVFSHTGFIQGSGKKDKGGGRRRESKKERIEIQWS